MPDRKEAAAQTRVAVKATLEQSASYREELAQMFQEAAERYIRPLVCR
jgi:hypothetical protein